MRHKSRSSLIALTLMLVAALALPSTAMAALEDPIPPDSLFSTTNPAVGEDGTGWAARSTWRWSWGNSLHPDLRMSQVPSDEGGDFGEQWRTIGFLYELRQVDPSGAGSETPVWGASSRATKDSADYGPSMTNTFDIVSANHRFGWTPDNGAALPGEGVYSVAWLYYNQFRVENVDSMNELYYGIDLTPPSPVEGLTASTTGLATKDGIWTEVRRRDLRWTMKGYDSLSGVGGFAATVNGQKAAFALNVGPDPTYEPYAELLNRALPIYPNMAQVNNITIEDIPAGVSTLGVKVVDRATNVSAERTVKAYVDYDTPQVSLASPASGAATSLKPTFKVNASDAAGITQVRYYVDDVFVGASTKSPFSLTANLSAFSNGTHTLKAVAYDQIGAAAPSVGSWKVPHTATATRSFKLDKSAPSISSVSGAPSPFFPRKRDGYKDDFKVKFKTSEAGTAKLTIKNSKGTVVRTVTKKVAAGSNSITWNGKYTSGSVKSGKFTYKLTVADAAGNVGSTSARRVSIKFYELVKTGKGRVKVIER